MSEPTTMQTKHRTIITDSRILTTLDNQSVDLVVTSPPYPMIEMWDELFATMSSDVKHHLRNNDGNGAFEAMHVELDKVWVEIERVLKNGTFACITIGDATRSIGNRFGLYPNHARIISSFCRLGFDMLPAILWRKQTNAPNKFMGSGMLPSGAYVTLEHEYILIFRKGSKRAFVNKAEKSHRMRSAFFWEERNRWFSDVWDFKGVSQSLTRNDLRNRSAAFPFELPYRLINMYSLYNDIVLDPFMGTGTTALAAIACGRNSIGIEIDASFSPIIIGQSTSCLDWADSVLTKRMADHQAFVTSRRIAGNPLKHLNTFYGFPVMTKQETGIEFFKPTVISINEPHEVAITYHSTATVTGNCGDAALTSR